MADQAVLRRRVNNGIGWVCHQPDEESCTARQNVLWLKTLTKPYWLTRHL